MCTLGTFANLYHFWHFTFSWYTWRSHVDNHDNLDIIADVNDIENNKFQVNHGQRGRGEVPLFNILSKREHLKGQKPDFVYIICFFIYLYKFCIYLTGKTRFCKYSIFLYMAIFHNPPQRLELCTIAFRKL